MAGPVEAPAKEYWVTGPEICEFLGVSPAQITDLVRREIVKKEGRNNYELGVSTRRYLGHLRHIASNRGGEFGGEGGEGGENLTAARTRLAVNTANEKEMKVQILRGELVRADEVERALSNEYRVVRAGLLAVPSRSGTAGGLNAKQVRVVDEEIRAVLAALGSGASNGEN